MRAGILRRIDTLRGTLATPPAWLPVAVVAAVGVHVGIGMVATRAVANQIDPIALTFVRYLIGAVCLLPLAMTISRLSLSWRDLPAISLLGIVQFGVQISLLNLGLQTVTAGIGSLIFATSPIWALAAGLVLREERFSGIRLTGMAVALAGLAIVLQVDPAQPAAGAVPGELLVLAAAICAALTSVWTRPFVRRYGALAVGTTASLATVAALALPALMSGVLTDLSAMSSGERWIVLYLGIGSGIGYGLWLWALKSITASTATAFLMLSPITSLLTGVLLLGEPLTGAAMLGTVVVGAGLWLTTSPRRTQASPAPDQVSVPGPG